MRFFKKKSDGESSSGDGTFVDGDVVYDANGNVIFDENIAKAALGEAQGIMPEPSIPADSVRTESAEPLTDFPATDFASETAEDLQAQYERKALARYDEMKSGSTPASSSESESTDLQAASDEIGDDSERLADMVLSSMPVSSGFEDVAEADLEVSLGLGAETVDVTTDVTPVPAPVSPSDLAKRSAVEPALLHKRVNLGEIRMDVARITSDIQSGERLYQRAQQRVESLMGFVERAEVDFSLLNRLEPENRRLKARNRVLEAESEANDHQLRRLQSELEDATGQLGETRSDLDGHQSKLRALRSQLAKRDDELKHLTQELEETAIKMERTQTTVEVESRENVVLREQIAELSTRIDDVTAERMELAKIVESLKIDCDDFRAQKAQAQGEVTDLRVALTTAQKVNGEMKTRMVALHDEIKGFKTQYEFNVISRDERIDNMSARIADLTKQLSIKEDVAKSALMDVAQLRKARSSQDLERERLERLVESQQRQLDEAQAQINRSTASMAELDQRYNDVAAALTVHQKRLTPSGVGTPLADPPPFKDKAAPAPSATNSVPPPAVEPEEALTPQNVEDLITDYKLGLRNKIA